MNCKVCELNLNKAVSLKNGVLALAYSHSTTLPQLHWGPLRSPWLWQVHLRGLLGAMVRQGFCQAWAVTPGPWQVRTLLLSFLSRTLLLRLLLQLQGLAPLRPDSFIPWRRLPSQHTHGSHWWESFQTHTCSVITWSHPLQIHEAWLKHSGPWQHSHFFIAEIQ